MDRNGERKAREIFLDALELEESDRQAFLQQATAEDPSIGARASELLAAHASSATLFEKLEKGSEPGRFGVPADLQPGTLLGVYKIVRTLGSGGFGTVYLAEQSEPVIRRVALKVMRSGLGSPDSHVRFAAERQALARMEHPGIARVFDAGETATGLPFFAMEFVPGQSLIEYCNVHELSTTPRLELFEDVCHAVAHAHQRGVLHRDIKPSNVLVVEIDGRPHIKVIDFGIAKAIGEPLTHQTLDSISGTLMGTPAYMSPEQAGGKTDIDTRTDVYSLGALLYELLADAPPFDSAALGLARLLQAILDEEPPLPSRRQRSRHDTTWIVRVPADLDWIAMRCLAKQRNRRYSSASAVAADIRRFLDGRPVEAAPPSAWYRASKLARRHAWLTFSAVVLVLAFGVGAFGIGVGLWHAREERDVAQSILEFLREDLLAAAQPALISGRGKDVKMLDVVDVAAKRLEAGEATERFIGKPRVAAAIRSTLAELYGSLGEYERSHLHIKAALQLYEDLGMSDSSEALRCASFQVTVLRGLGRSAEAVRLAEETLAAQMAGSSSDSKDVIQSRVHLAFAINAAGSPSAAVVMAERALQDLQRQKSPDRVLLAMVYNALAITHSADGDLEQAEQFFRRQLEVEREHFGPGSLQALTAEGNLASNLQAQGRYAEASERLREVIGPLSKALSEKHPSVLKFRRNLGSLLLQQGEVSAARAELELVLDASVQQFGPGHVETASARAGLAECLVALGESEQAETLFRRALADSRIAVGPDAHDTHMRREDLIDFLSKQGLHGDELIALAEEEFESRTRAAGASHSSTLRAQTNLALMHRRIDNFEESEALYRSAFMGFGETLGWADPETLETQGSLIDLLRETGRLEEAEELARDALELVKGDPPADPQWVAKAKARLAFALVDLDEFEEARSLLEEAREGLRASLGSDHVWTRYVIQLLGELPTQPAASSDE